MLFRHVLLAIDFSDESEVAARTLFRLAESMVSCERVTVVHATEPVVLPSARESVLRARLEALQEKLLAEAEARARAFCARVGGSGKVEVRAVAGRPAVVVPQLAQELGVSLVVLGTHSRRGIRRLFFGSIAEAAVARLNVPSLVLHVGGDGVPPDAELLGLETILVGIELGPGAEEVLDGAVLLSEALRPDAKLALVHAVDTSRRIADAELLAAFESELEEAARAELERLAERVPRPERVERHVVRGESSDVLLRFARDLDARLIVIGEKKGPLAVLGSTGVHVLRGADVGVLVVPISDG
ncbi:MAG: universal stress protein [Deltaproteobacteria bacterium]|nr:universal stress protein [Deltaproteobacteria bacterium]